MFFLPLLQNTSAGKEGSKDAGGVAQDDRNIWGRVKGSCVCDLQS